MAWSPTPTAYMADWEVDGTDIVVPIASFSELTAAEAAGDTGDIRSIIFAFLEQWFDVWNALATADRSTKMIIQRVQTGLPGAIIQQTYTVTFQMAPTDLEVADEPSP